MKKMIATSLIAISILTSAASASCNSLKEDKATIIKIMKKVSYYNLSRDLFVSDTQAKINGAKKFLEIKGVSANYTFTDSTGMSKNVNLTSFIPNLQEYIRIKLHKKENQKVVQYFLFMQRFNIQSYSFFEDILKNDFNIKNKKLLNEKMKDLAVSFALEANNDKSFPEQLQFQNYDPEDVIFNLTLYNNEKKSFLNGMENQAYKDFIFSIATRNFKKADKILDIAAKKMRYIEEGGLVYCMPAKNFINYLKNR